MEEKKDQGSEVKEEVKVGKTNSSSKLIPFVLGIVVFLLVGAVGFVVYSYSAAQKLSQSDTVLKTAEVFNFGAAVVNGEKVSYLDYIRDINALGTFYNNQPEGSPLPTEEQISDQVITRLVANMIVSQVAEEFDVEVEESELTEAEEQLLANFEDKETAEEELNKNYGLTLAEYRDAVITPVILEDKVKEAFLNSDVATQEGGEIKEIKASHILFMVGQDDNKQDVRTDAQAVLDRIKAGEDFPTLAGEFGTDSTAENGGDLGWFGRGVMVPEFEAAVFALEAGELGSELVETQFGFHIVKVEGKRAGFVGYMEAKLKEAEIELLLPIHDPFVDLFGEDSENEEEGGEEGEEGETHEE